MTPDQRETHCGDSGVKLDVVSNRIEPIELPENLMAEAAKLIAASRNDFNKSYFSLPEPRVPISFVAREISHAINAMAIKELAGYVNMPPFPEPATDPWEEQG